MARQIINVGSTANDGTGDGLRTAYIKCNDNFQELYNTSIAPTAIINGTSNVSVIQDGNVTIAITGSANAAVFSSQKFETANIDIATDLTVGNSVTITQDITVGDQLIITGTLGSNLIPDGNNTRDLGRANARFNDLYLSGSSIILGDIVLKAGSGNVLEVYGSDGTTPGTISPTITNGTSNIAIATTDGNATVSVNGTANVLVIDDAGANLAGTLATTGAISTVTSIDATGNITGGNINTGGAVVATGNLTGAYIIGDGGFISNVTAASNVAVTQIANGTSVVAIGSSGGNVEISSNGTLIIEIDNTDVTVTGNLNATDISSTQTITATGNIEGGNINTGGAIVATGNITGDYILGNGRNLTGIDSTAISNGGSNVSVPTNNGNVTISVNSQANVVVVDDAGANVTGAFTITGNLSSGNIYTGGELRGATITDGTLSINSGAITSGVSASFTGNISGGNISTGGVATVTGNITGGNVTTTGKVTATGNVTGGNIITAGIASVTGNITGGNVTTGGRVTATGNVTGGNLMATSGTANTALLITQTGTFTTLANVTAATAATSTTTGSLKTAGGLGVVGNAHVGGNVTAGNFITAGLVSLTSITKTGTTGVGNIGSTSNTFNTVHAQATSAQYADLAEMYTSDYNYAAGTVVVFGGSHEVTAASEDASTQVAGVVSTQPAHLMNTGTNGVAVALLGRVPTKVRGPVAKGDMMVSTTEGYARAEANPKIGTVIGKALEEFDGQVGVIEVVVGRL